jgi:integrase
MARKIRSNQLESRTQRLKLTPRKKPYMVRVSPGVRLGYRRNEGAGTWSVIVADGAGSSWLKQFALADDFEAATDGHVLDFWQAQDKARVLARGGGDGSSDEGRPVTVLEALAAYETDLQGRGGDAGNVTRVRFHLPASLASRTVGLLSARELRHWRDALIKKGLRPATVKRHCKPLIAALNLAASLDPRITNRDAWKIGLASLPGAEVARNAVISDDAVRRLIACAYDESPTFGLLVETAALTGARPSQLRRLEKRDLVAGPRLMMPSSMKGRGQKRIERRPVPIPQSLAVALKRASAGRPDDAPLLLRAAGNPWTTNSHSEPFQRVAARAGLDPSEVTIYTLRHSSITRQLIGGVPIRVVASLHDTSVQMIEATYSKHIGDHSDTLVRRNLLDVARPGGENVIPLKGT